MNYYKKYLKYKSKYTKLKISIMEGGVKFEKGTKVKFKEGIKGIKFKEGINNFLVLENKSENKSMIKNIKTGSILTVNDDDLELNLSKTTYKNELKYIPFKKISLENNNKPICLICYKEYNSPQHLRNCTTVLKFENKEEIIEPINKFKPMMTYGLDKSEDTAALIAVKKDNKFIKVMLIHNILINVIKYVRNKLEEYKNSEYSLNIIIRDPGNYQKIEEKWVFISKKLKFWNNLKTNKNIKLCIEAYNDKNLFFNYDTTLHCRLDNDKLQYTNTLGNWVNIEKCDKK